MEWINTSNTVRRELVYAVCYPACSITYDDLYAGLLLICELSIELGEHSFSVAISRPHYGVCIVVDDDCDVFIAFAVTGLVYAYVDKPIKASGQIRLEIMQAPPRSRPLHTLRDCDGLSYPGSFLRPQNGHLFRFHEFGRASIVRCVTPS